MQRQMIYPNRYGEKTGERNSHSFCHFSHFEYIYICCEIHLNSLTNKRKNPETDTRKKRKKEKNEQAHRAN